MRRYLILNSNAPDLMELFLVASIASVLAIRAFLAATGYPQLGGAGLHIAHMLWGGIFMTIALFVLFSLLGPTSQRFAAILAGIGFGTFIDELGKFITSDHNYFFEPTNCLGIIYGPTQRRRPRPPVQRSPVPASAGSPTRLAAGY